MHVTHIFAVFNGPVLSHSNGRGIKKMWYVYTMEYYLAIKRNNIGSFVVMWMNLEFVIQSEVSQKKKYCILTHIYGI